MAVFRVVTHSFNKYFLSYYHMPGTNDTMAIDKLLSTDKFVIFNH